MGSAHSFAGTLPEGGTCAAGHVAQPSPPVGSRTLVCSPRALSVNAAAASRALRVSPGTSAPVGTLPHPPPAHLCVGLCGWTRPGFPSRRASGAHLAPPPAPLPSAAARPAKPSFLSALPVGREDYALAGAGAGTLVHGQEALCFRQGREGTGDRCGCPRPPVPPACPVGGCLPGLQTLQPGPWAPPSGWSWRCSRWLHFLTHRPGGCCPQSPAPPTAPPATPSALAWCSIGFSCPAALGQAVSPHPVLGAAPMTVGHRLRNSPQEECPWGRGQLREAVSYAKQGLVVTPSPRVDRATKQCRPPHQSKPSQRQGPVYGSPASVLTAMQKGGPLHRTQEWVVRPSGLHATRGGLCLGARPALAPMGPAPRRERHQMSSQESSQGCRVETA